MSTVSGDVRQDDAYNPGAGDAFSRQDTIDPSTRVPDLDAIRGPDVESPAARKVAGEVAAGGGGLAFSRSSNPSGSKVPSLFGTPQAGLSRGMAPAGGSRVPRLPSKTPR